MLKTEEQEKFKEQTKKVKGSYRNAGVRSQKCRHKKDAEVKREKGKEKKRNISEKEDKEVYSGNREEKE